MILALRSGLNGVLPALALFSHLLGDFKKPPGDADEGFGILFADPGDKLLMDHLGLMIDLAEIQSAFLGEGHDDPAFVVNIPLADDPLLFFEYLEHVGDPAGCQADIFGKLSGSHALPGVIKCIQDTIFTRGLQKLCQLRNLLGIQDLNIQKIPGKIFQSITPGTAVTV